VSQPAPGTGDLPNNPAVGVVNLSTGVVTHVDATLQRPKRLLCIGGYRQRDRDGGDGRR